MTPVWTFQSTFVGTRRCGDDGLQVRWEAREVAVVPWTAVGFQPDQIVGCQRQLTGFRGGTQTAAPILGVVIGASLGAAALVFCCAGVFFAVHRYKSRKELEEREPPPMVRTYSVGNLANRSTVYADETELDAMDGPLGAGCNGAERFRAARGNMGFLD